MHKLIKCCRESAIRVVYLYYDNGEPVLILSNQIFVLASYRFSWEQVKFLCHRRRRYIQLYASSLQKMSNVNTIEMRDIEKDLDAKVILLWRYAVFENYVAMNFISPIP